jgi:hypothetical protein
VQALVIIRGAILSVVLLYAVGTLAIAVLALADQVFQIGWGYPWYAVPAAALFMSALVRFALAIGYSKAADKRRSRAIRAVKVGVRRFVAVTF